MNTPLAEAPRPKPTVVDVAIAANVAVGTVSRVLNTPELVGADIRQRVVETIERLDYRPLRRRRRRPPPSRTKVNRRGNIGVIFFGMDDSLSRLPVFAEAVRGIERTVAGGTENVMRANIPTADRIPLFMTRNLVDGLIVRSPLVGDVRDHASPELLGAIERLPHVWLLARPPNTRGDVVESDREAAALLAVEYLHARGHRRLALFQPYPGPSAVNDVRHATLTRAEHLGLTVQAFKAAAPDEVRWPWPAITEPKVLLPLVDEWAAVPVAKRPTAIVVGADGVAVQLYAALAMRGVRVGRDVSVFSLRHEKGLAGDLSPALASIDIRPEDIGRRAVEQLRWRFEHPNDRLPIGIRIPPALLEGDSVAKIG